MIRLTSKYEIELLSQPLTGREDQVLYIESDYDQLANEYVKENLATIKRIFGREMLDFIYVRKEDSPIDADGVVCTNATYAAKGSYRLRAYHVRLHDFRHGIVLMEEFKQIAKAYSLKGVIDYGKYTSDTETVVLLEEMENIARALKLKGVKPELFDEMVSALEQPVPLVVSHYGKIHLPELGDISIRMNPTQLTLYVLFLQHPEGISADELVGFRSELLGLYRRFSRLGDTERYEEVVDTLLDEDKDVLYSVISKIRTIFTRTLGSRLASHYYISRSNEDGKYRIALPEDMRTVE